MPKSSFVLYLDYRKHLDLIHDDSDFRRLIEAIFAYCEDGEEPSNLSPIATMAFSFIRSNLDRDNIKYESVKEKRKESGRLGGIARASKAKQNVANEANANFAKQNVANEAVNVNENVNENVSDIKRDTLSECLSGQSPDATSWPEDSESEELSARRPSCPVKEIVALYHDILPEHPRVEILNEARRRSINARWSDIGRRLKAKGREDGRAERIAYMRQIFLKASQSDFLCGRTTGRNGDTYMVTFDKLMSPSGFIGVIEGKYDNRC